MYSAIGAAVAAQHVRDLLDQAAQDHRAATVRRARRTRAGHRPAPASPVRAAGHGTTTAPC
ncbi:MAG: hypothetical protein ACLPKI_12445 [Streptosporangiaceae bacterium]